MTTAARTLRDVLLALLVGLGLGDVLTTAVGLALGHAEANPVLDAVRSRYGSALMLAAVLVLKLVGAGLVWRLASGHSPTVRGAALSVGLFAAVLSVMIVVRNLRILA